MTDAEFQVKQLKTLLGGTLTDVVTDVEGMDSPDEAFVGLVIRKDNKETTLWVQRDAEGNGPGFLNPEPWISYLP